MLIQAGADINNLDEDSCTPLHLCFYRNNTNCLESVLKYKPKTDIRNKAGKTALECAFIDDMDEILKHVLFD